MLVCWQVPWLYLPSEPSLFPPDVFNNRMREAFPDMWVLWAHASSSARLEQSFRDIADRVKINGRQDSEANIFKLVHDWMCNTDERWLLVLDNVDDAGFLFDAQATTLERAAKPLHEYFPNCAHGCVIITTRNKEAALQLVEQRDIIALDPMSAPQAQTLLAKKLGVHADSSNAAELTELATVLEHMPLALVQAAAYISHRSPLCSVAQYLDQFKNSERKRTSLLSYDKGHLRRDREAKNSIITTWQITFEYIQQTRPSAADLLSLMSFFDRQGIPKNVLQTQAEWLDEKANRTIEEARVDRNKNDNSVQLECNNDGNVEEQLSEFEIDVKNQLRNDSADDSEDNNSEDDNSEDDNSEDDNSEDDNSEDDNSEDDNSEDDNSEDDNSEDDNSEDDDSEDDAFLDDVTALRNFGFISISTDGTTFEMHALVQLSMRTWLVANGRLERYKEQFVNKLNAVFPTAHYENWAACQALFAHAKAAIVHKPETESSLVLWAHLMYYAACYAYEKRSAGETETLAIHSLKASEMVLGQEHMDTLWSMTLLADAYTLQGRWDEAEKLHVQVMERRKTMLRADHPATLTSISNLASTFQDQG